jgi:hypothetical protein
VQAGASAIPFGPVSAGTQVEWSFDPARVDELRQTAAESGGRELLDLKDAWKNPPVIQFMDLRPWLLPVLLGLVLLDALATRLGWRLGELPAMARALGARLGLPVASPAMAGGPAGAADDVGENGRREGIERNPVAGRRRATASAAFGKPDPLAKVEVSSTDSTPVVPSTGPPAGRPPVSPKPAATPGQDTGRGTDSGSGEAEAAAAERRRVRFARAKKGGG